MIRRALATLVVGLAVAAGCSRGGAPAPEAGPRPPARVNGEAVGADAVRRELSQLAAGDAAPPTAELRHRALDAVVERALVLQEAQRRGATVKDEEVEHAFGALRAEYPPAAFEELLAQQKTSAAEVRTRLGEQLRMERVVADALAKVKVSDAEVRTYYDAHGDEFARGEQVKVLQVVTRTREDAEKARAEIARKPASFGDVARRASIAPEGKAGGELGWFGKDSGMPEVFLGCLKLPKNQLSPVMASPYGFHVFKVVDRRPAGRQPFEAVAGEIGQKLLAERRSRAQEEFLAGLRQAAKIEVDEAALAAVVPEAP